MANSPSGESMTSRIVRIISAFDETHQSMPVAVLARRAELPLSTTHRMVKDLAGHGFLQREPDGGVRLGLRLWELANRSSAALGLKQIAMPYMEDIQAVVRQHTQLSVLRQDEVLFIERLSSHGSVLNHAKVAGRLPVHVSSSGMVMMAHSPRHVQEAYLLRRNLADREEQDLRASWTRIRLEGSASLPGAVVPDTTGIAVPVFGASGTAVAAIGVVVPTGSEHTTATVPALMTAARGISRGLGVRADAAGPHYTR
ncbi:MULTISPECIES: IclR family transcriptional regulator [unclassified Arthrobacter]|uniref:IclR family transcriptional regulator n=1 Tax=unclassified Arthrobacter TaxID=235627 RepID=UPI001E2916E4|nr:MULTISPECIES: IclR family transcriptional regulator [unclassified Arthrobacter]MCC9144874.1 IclR family transcriptional regulator [Arthrobacter sp. zg-Y919]MDK1276100.1 IclR family transcriptional regulator [Arthrobacter sp. zg.Y919]MDM7990035.1 IclR family transcriptional regulator [Arthrobacter sp. zg-Y877]WIB02558.1 IclR family transcriptional regulator [Arthrobacter sp. zg-Y919]